MANNYTQWSEMIPLSEDETVREEEKAWIRSVLQDRDDRDETEKVLRESGIDPNELDVEFWPDFSWEFEGADLWVYSEEAANLDHLAVFVQAFLRKFAPDKVFSLEWASYCSKPRVGEFGGGALVVSAKEVLCTDTASLAEDLRRKAFSPS